MDKMSREEEMAMDYVERLYHISKSMEYDRNVMYNLVLELIKDNEDLKTEVASLRSVLANKDNT